MKPYVVAGIFARGGSKGVPRKNIRPLGGRPLIAHAIEVARRSLLIDRVIVSTDDEEIADVAAMYGAEVPFMRPADLARDDSAEWLAWQHAILTLRGSAANASWDAFVCVPTTSPLRKVEDLDACIASLLGSDADAVITVRHAARSPYYNMVTVDDSSYARLLLNPPRETVRRQEAPIAYEITTVAYALRPAFVLSAASLFQGRIKAVVIPQERALDIDTELDFTVAECLLRRSESP